MAIGAPFRNKLVYLAARLESVRGTAETTPVTGDTCCVLTDIAPDIEVEKIRQMAATGRYTELQALLGKAIGSVKFKHSMRLALAAGPAAIPSFDKFLRGLGQKPAATSGVESYTPNLDQDVAQTLTIWICFPNSEQDEIVIGLKGCKGQGSYKVATGQPLVYDVEFRGTVFFAGAWSGTFPAYSAYAAEQRAPVFQDGTMVIGGKERSITEMTVNFGHTLAAVESGAAGDKGVAYHHISNREPTVSLKVRADLNSGTEDFVAAVTTHVARMPVLMESEEVTASLSSVVYAMNLAVAIPALDIQSIKKDDISGDLSWQVEAIPEESSGGDEFTVREEYATVV